ncbi:type II toxin-antitoxin system VapC family toxin [Alicycliphilus denitrificans]|uniref:type II toxin-antitoxin system VapC family toxin n=1 Tax=Alicycliphilus denitrificans TaxID=179636 RepID=UPI003851700F
MLDTNILSELRRPRPEPQVVAFVSAQPLESLFVSSVTFAEIRFDIERIEDLHKRSVLTDWLNLELRPMFENRVLPVSEDVMFRWRLLVKEGRKTGHTFPQPDLIIAATALHYGLSVVTRDTGGHDKTAVSLVNPWRL